MSSRFAISPACFAKLAGRVEEERQTGSRLSSFSGASLRESLTTMTHDGDGDARRRRRDGGYAAAHYAHAAALLDRIATFASVAAANVAALDGAQPHVQPRHRRPRSSTEPRALLAPLRSVLAHDSLVLRHALRVAIVTAAAVLAAPARCELARGYWVTVTAVIILQPYTGVTTPARRTARHRHGPRRDPHRGRSVRLFHDIRAILVLSFIFAAVSVALLPINYTAFSVFLTPTFVLLAEASAGDWHLATVRVINTLLGGAIALLGARLLWPAPEWRRLPAYLAATLRANRDYLQTVVRSFADRSNAAGEAMRTRRRDAALAAINAEESFQRLLGGAWREERAARAGDDVPDVRTPVHGVGRGAGGEPSRRGPLDSDDARAVRCDSDGAAGWCGRAPRVERIGAARASGVAGGVVGTRTRSRRTRWTRSSARA